MSHLLGRKTTQGRTTHLYPGLLAVRSHCGLAPGRVRPRRLPSPVTVGGRQTVFTGESQRAGWAGSTRSDATGHRQFTLAVQRTRPGQRGCTRRFPAGRTAVGGIGQVTLIDGAFDRLSATFGGPRWPLCHRSSRMTSVMSLRMSAPLRHGSGSALASRAEADLLHTWRPHRRSLGRVGRMRHCVVEAEAGREGECAKLTGEVQVVKVFCGEGISQSTTLPEPCGRSREGAGEASAEGNTGRTAKARFGRVPRYRFQQFAQMTALELNVQAFPTTGQVLSPT